MHTRPPPCVRDQKNREDLVAVKCGSKGGNDESDTGFPTQIQLSPTARSSSPLLPPPSSRTQSATVAANATQLNRRKMEEYRNSNHKLNC
ncbi:unnamed protein product [Linum trigynum]|uniref:Uncharacterized protein n=1 Tax=Linum trigynum TaxID=586398 RepID=A0AAV2CFN0_9ROSI